jgi:serine/threonine-protein kinase
MAAVEELKKLGRYEIKGVLGKGAMGLVYDGIDPTLNRRVAIKTILTRNLDEATAKHYEMRFKREVKAVARLNHPHIVQVYDFGTEGDLAYIVMEYIEGRELKDSFDKKEPFQLKTVLELMLQILDALDFAHQQQVIHRDIKPANVMVDTKGNAKLADFGVARITDPDADTGEATRAGAMVGTPSYMSPEQIQGQTIDSRTDVFSAGILFYQLLTRQKPFEGTGFALAKKIVTDDPVWPSQLVNIGPEFDRVCARALAKDAALRYQKASDFAAALKRIMQGKPPEDPNEKVAAPPAGAPAPVATRASEAETELWVAIKDSDDPDEVGIYLEQFPRGFYSEEAKKKIAALKG